MAMRVASLTWQWDDRRGAYLIRFEPAATRSAFVAMATEGVRSVGSFCVASAERLVQIEPGDATECDEITGVTASLVQRLSPRDLREFMLLRDTAGPLHVGQCVFDFDDKQVAPPPGPAVDPRLALVYSAFVQNAPLLANGTIELVRVAGTPGKVLFVAIRAPNIDIEPVGEMLGFRGAALHAATARLGGSIELFELHPDPMVFAMRVLHPARAARLSLDQGVLTLLEPYLEVDASKEDDEVLAFAEARRALASELVGLPIRLETPWQIRTTGG